MFSVQHSPGVQLRAAARATSRHSPRRRAGSLKDALSFFWKHDINLTRLESRPRCGAARSAEAAARARVACSRRGRCSARSRDYDFYVSFEGSAADAKTRGLLKDLEVRQARAEGVSACETEARD